MDRRVPLDRKPRLAIFAELLFDGEEDRTLRAVLVLTRAKARLARTATPTSSCSMPVPA